jgi:hypothetical protein
MPAKRRFTHYESGMLWNISIYIYIYVEKRN